MRTEDLVEPSVVESDAAPWQESLTGREVGDFAIGERIGEGGYGRVYQARQKSLARAVVIKALRWRDEADRDRNTQRFLREATLASRLDHPYAAHIYAFGVEPDGLLWIAMEFVRGTSLRDILESQGTMPLPRFLPLFEKICEVVHHAHQQGIVHRDLKPSNLMVMTRSGMLLPKLLDFGIARILPAERVPVSQDDDGTATDSDPSDSLRAISHAVGSDSLDIIRDGVPQGSPPYMAPEQWTSSCSPDGRTDQYALAVMAYEVLIGRRPFSGPNVHAIAMAHAARPVPPLGPGFPPELDAVFARAMAKDPADRHDDVVRFAAAVRASTGLVIEPDRVPRLEDSLRTVLMAGAPQPLADSVAHLETAPTPRRALEAARRVCTVAARLVGLYAVAAASHLGPGDDECGEDERDALRRLRLGSLSARGWLEVARALVQRFRDVPEAHPIPELVRLFTESSLSASDLDALDVLDALPGKPQPERAPKNGPLRDGPVNSTADHASGDETPDAVLARVLPRLTALLEKLSFLCVYPVVVCSRKQVESRMGVRRSVRAPTRVYGHGDLTRGDVVLTGSDGEFLLALSPLCQLLVPAPGATEELFLLDGPSHFGARLVAFPMRFERHDNEFWPWYRGSLAEFDRDAHRPEAGLASRAPYMGLSAFSTEDAEWYFGREYEVSTCVNRLRTEPLLVVVGPSGVGKSSFVHAGIVPALPGDWRVITVRPGPAPVAQLEAGLARYGFAAVDDLGRRLQEDGGFLAHLVDRQSGDASGGQPDGAGDGEQPLVLVIDQFEEVLTLCLDDRERALYTEGLMRATEARPGAFRVIITLRDDFLIRVQQLPALRERLSHSLQLLSTPPPEELARILIEPARRSGYEFEDPGLPGEMVEQVTDEPGALALLSFTASKIWDARDRRRQLLTRRAHESIGGVGGALAQHAEATLEAMAPEQTAHVREVFRQLVTADCTRAILNRGELRQILGRDALAEPVLEALIHARLLVASEGEGGEDRIEVVHEALLTSWPRLVEWQREDAESVRLRDQLRATARQWDERGRSVGLLWRGDALLEYQVWRTRYRGSLTRTEEEFARASVRQETRGRRIRRSLAIAAFVALGVGFAVMLHLERQASSAREEAQSRALEVEDQAREAERRMIESMQEQGRQALLSGGSMRAYAQLVHAHAQGADNTALHFMLAQATRSLDDQLLILDAHDEMVVGVRFSPDGSRLVTADLGKTAKVWDSRTGDLLLTLRGHEDAIRAVQYDHDGTRLVTASMDGTARVWNATTGEHLFSARHDSWLRWAGFDPRGTRLATTSKDSTAKIWDASSGDLLRTLRGHERGVNTGAFGPRGALFATGGIDERVKIWNLGTGEMVAGSETLEGVVTHLAFSPDGKTLAASAGISALWLISTDTGHATALLGHDGMVRKLAFSPDGGHLVTASDDHTARVWDVATGRTAFTLRGHTSPLTHADFSRDGSRLVTTSRDATAKIWDSSTGELLWTFAGHRTGLWAGDLSADGRRLATADYNGTVRLWRADKTQHDMLLPAQPQIVRRAVFSPDASRIATAQADGTVQIWDRQGERSGEFETGRIQPYLAWHPDGGSLLVSGGHRQAVVWRVDSGEERAGFGADGEETMHAVFSPDGAHVATAGRDGTAKLWNASDGSLVRVFRGHDSTVTFVDFDSRGQTLATASEDGTARIWNVDTGELQQALPDQDQKLRAVRFSAEGTKVIVSGEGQSASVWTTTGERVSSLEGHSSSLEGVAFASDDQLAITASSDGTTRVWDVGSGRELWSFAADSSQVWSVDVDHHGRFVLAATGQSARVWDLAWSPKTQEELAGFSSCRVGYIFDRGSLVPREPDPRTCAHR